MEVGEKWIQWILRGRKVYRIMGMQGGFCKKKNLWAMHGHAKSDGDGGFGSMHFTASFLFHQTTNTHSLGRGSHLAITDTSSKALLVISVTENYSEGSIETERCSLIKKKYLSTKHV